MYLMRYLNTLSLSFFMLTIILGTNNNVNADLKRDISNKNEDTIKATKKKNFCQINQKVEQNQISLKNALHGENISIAISDEVDEINPYIAVRVLDEVSRRAQFQYTAYVTGRPKINETWSDKLFNDVKDHDLAVDWWMRTTPRLSQGIIFPYNWYDADNILIMKKEPPSDSFYLFAFCKPFSPWLWLTLFSTIIITALVYFYLDFLHCKGDKSKMFSSIEGCIFFSAYGYTGSRSVFPAKSRASQLLLISMAFLYLILVSAYTANLTNYYVIKEGSNHPINDLEDVVRYDLLLCVMRGFGKEEILSKKQLNPRTLELETEKDMFIGISDGICDVALVSQESYLLLKRDVDYNRGCDIEWVGRRVFISSAGFALADSEELCSSLLDRVLDYYLFEMKTDGVIDTIMEQYRETSTLNTCELKSKMEETNSSSINILNVGGVFLVHFFLILISTLVATCEYYPRRKKNGTKGKSVITIQSNIFNQNDSEITSSMRTKNLDETQPSKNKQLEIICCPCCGSAVTNHSKSESIQKLIYDNITFFKNFDREVKAEKIFYDELKEIKGLMRTYLIQKDKNT